MSESEVARLLKEIELTYEAARNGVKGISSGSTKHAFIAMKMDHLDEQRKSLAQIVGEDQAMDLLVKTLENV